MTADILSGGTFSNLEPEKLSAADILRDVSAALAALPAAGDPVVAIQLGSEALARLKRQARFSDLPNGFELPIRTSSYTPPLWWGFVRRNAYGVEYFAEHGVLQKEWPSP